MHDIVGTELSTHLYLTSI